MATTETALAQRGGHELMRMDPSELIARAIDAGAGIETMERLVALAKDMRAQMARDAWYEAMAKFQADCPSIRKTKRATITGRASYSYTYAPLDEILSVVQPVMGPLGLSVSWRQRMETDKVVVSCRVSHTMGHHEESGEIAMPVSLANAEVGANPMQRVGIATTYAKRYSLLGIIGMAPEDDPDAKGQEAPPQRPTSAPTPERGLASDNQGGGASGVISEPQAKRLWAIARDSLWSQDEVHAYLKPMGFESAGAITRDKYEGICDHIKMHPRKPPAAA